MTSQTITDRIHEKADRALRARINKPFNALLEELKRDFPLHSGGGWEHVKNPFPSTQWDAKVWVPARFDELVAAAFEALQGANRTKAVNEFVAKVETLGAQLEELQQEVRQ